MEKYKRVRIIGKGAYGSAVLVQRGGAQYVLKEVPLEGLAAKEKVETQREAQLLRDLDHPNIVRYVDSGVSRGALYIVMDYANGGDLDAYVQRKKRTGQRFSAEEALSIFAQLCRAIAHIHDRKILHRDLKSKNVFLHHPPGAASKFPVVKLGDFGIAKVLEGTRDHAKTQIGTPYYLSPEICEDRPYNTKSDIWSLGCVLYEMLALQVPFQANDLASLVKRIMRLPAPTLPLRYRNHDGLSALYNSLLQKQPGQRPDIHRVLATPVMKRALLALDRRNDAGDGVVATPTTAAPDVASSGNGGTVVQAGRRGLGADEVRQRRPSAARAHRSERGDANGNARRRQAKANARATAKADRTEEHQRAQQKLREWRRKLREEQQALQGRHAGGGGGGGGGGGVSEEAGAHWASAAHQQPQVRQQRKRRPSRASKVHHPQPWVDVVPPPQDDDPSAAALDGDAGGSGDETLRPGRNGGPPATRWVRDDRDDSDRRDAQQQPQPQQPPPPDSRDPYGRSPWDNDFGGVPSRAEEPAVQEPRARAQWGAPRDNPGTGRGVLPWEQQQQPSHDGDQRRRHGRRAASPPDLSRSQVLRDAAKQGFAERREAARRNAARINEQLGRHAGAPLADHSSSSGAGARQAKSRHGHEQEHSADHAGRMRERGAQERAEAQRQHELQLAEARRQAFEERRALKNRGGDSLPDISPNSSPSRHRHRHQPTAGNSQHRDRDRDSQQPTSTDLAREHAERRQAARRNAQRVNEQLGRQPPPPQQQQTQQAPAPRLHSTLEEQDRRERQRAERERAREQSRVEHEQLLAEARRQAFEERQRLAARYQEAKPAPKPPQPPVDFDELPVRFRDDVSVVGSDNATAIHQPVLSDEVFKKRRQPPPRLRKKHAKPGPRKSNKPRPTAATSPSPAPTNARGGSNKSTPPPPPAEPVRLDSTFTVSGGSTLPKIRV